MFFVIIIPLNFCIFPLPIVYLFAAVAFPTSRLDCFFSRSRSSNTANNVFYAKNRTKCTPACLLVSCEIWKCYNLKKYHPLLKNLQEGEVIPPQTNLFSNRDDINNPIVSGVEENNTTKTVTINSITRVPKTNMNLHTLFIPVDICTNRQKEQNYLYGLGLSDAPDKVKPL